MHKWLCASFLYFSLFSNVEFGLKLALQEYRESHCWFWKFYFSVCSASPLASALSDSLTRTEYKHHVLWLYLTLLQWFKKHWHWRVSMTGYHAMAASSQSDFNLAINRSEWISDVIGSSSVFFSVMTSTCKPCYSTHVGTFQHLIRDLGREGSCSITASMSYLNIIIHCTCVISSN